MRNPIIISSTLHLAVFAAAWISNPFSARSPLEFDQEVLVEVAVLAEEPTTPKPRNIVPKAPPKPLPPKVKRIDPPKPPPILKKIEPRPKPPVPNLKSDSKTKIKPKPAPKPQQLAAVPEMEKAANAKIPPLKPAAKPTPPDEFSSVLNSVEQFKAKSPQTKPKSPKSLSEEVKDVLKRNQPSSKQTLANLGDTLTNSERESVRRQIEECWIVPSGARGAENLVIEIRLLLNLDGTVIKAKIVDSADMARDPFYRAAAESALRAVLNSACSPLRLPPKKYEQWKNMVLSFNPRNMF